MIRFCAEPSCAEPILLSAQGKVVCLSPAYAAFDPTVPVNKAFLGHLLKGNMGQSKGTYATKLR